MPIFRFKSVKIYTGQKNLHWRRQWRQWQLWGMTWPKPNIVPGAFYDMYVNSFAIAIRRVYSVLFV